ncbi:unnamed protein product [Effrenium voratum]|uniref:BTB domain-containing protein n=1 Tax=Effrenium voratum TaxID=2562239 RepID=A0AA36JP96_9DINO|nr:unnamed protein product [Effrenium voratum]CAJ1436290.1 unnamed protein product [Effrenium voratum]
MHRSESQNTYDWLSTWGPESRRASDSMRSDRGDWRATPGRDSSSVPTDYSDYSDDHYVAANVKIASHPGHYMNHEACHLINAGSMEYWASLPGQTRDQAFVFEFEQGHVLAAVEWKDRGDGMGVQRLALEAKVNGEWQKLSTWTASRKPDWQVHKMTMSIRSSLWRLTFHSNHGDENHLVVQAVRFVTKIQKTEPAHNVGYPQKITRQIWGDRRFTDVEVICGGKTFPVHRAVLAAASTVFAAMLDTEMKESQAREIIISDSDEESVQHMLEYIYTGCVAERAGCGMIVLGHKYDIPGLVEYASPVALGNITPDNCVAQVRILRAYVDDERLGPVFEALLNKIHESPKIFKSMMLGI